MIRIFTTCLAMSWLVACNSGGAKDDTSTKGTTDNTTNPDYQKGLELVAQNKCMTCHLIDEKLTGPAYREVAKKYTGMPDTIVSHLASKVISGGSGVWGPIMMTPHPDLSKEDAEAMVKYILLLNKK